MLLLDCDRIVSIERLVDAVWGSLPPETARKQILICISVLKKLFKKCGFAGEIAFHVPGYVLRLGDGDTLDLKDFEAKAEAGRIAFQENRHADAMKIFHDALALWRGEPLAGTISRLIEVAAIGLTERRLCVAEMYADVCLRFRTHHNLVEDLRLLTAAHPLRETLHVRLMRALAQSGRAAEAIEVYREARHTFVDELGLEPGKELRQLRSAILASRQNVEHTVHTPHESTTQVSLAHVS